MPSLDCSYDQLFHLEMYEDQSIPEFYPNAAQLSGSCYEPTPSHLDHGIINMDTNRSSIPPGYGYSACSMPPMGHSINSMYTSQPSWHNSQPHLDDKRGPVIMGQAPPQPPVKRKGGRKPKDDPNLPPLEKEKRRLRRLRNKEAAAKCRERRLNHTSSLLQQIEQLEKSQKSYEEKIGQLRQHKEQCEELLKSHGQNCNKTFSAKSPSASSVSSQSCQASPASTAVSTPPSTPSIAPPPPSVNRRKQPTPRLNLDMSCADLHRRASSSSSGEMQSPTITL